MALVDLTKMSRLTGHTGAELSGVKIASDDPKLANYIRTLVLQHRVVVIRGQFITPDEQLVFGQRFGSFVYTPGLEHNTLWPDIYRIENQGKAKARTENWHTDGSYGRFPPSFTILAAQEIPSVGGDTLFANLAHAYQRLSPAYKSMLCGLRACHVGHGLLADGRDPPSHTHPLVRILPETGERVLYINGLAALIHIEGMTHSESRGILQFLFDHAIALDGQCRVRWQPGDVVVWDNRATLHAAVHDYGDACRTLTRLMISGEEPVNEMRTGDGKPGDVRARAMGDEA
jgi:taurine dioxygenase